MLSAPESFCYKRFFQLCGLSSKTPKEIQDVFHILDDDNSGYIEESELKCVKQCSKVNYTCETCSSGNSQRHSHARLWAMPLRDVRDGGFCLFVCFTVCAGTSCSSSNQGRGHWLRQKPRASFQQLMMTVMAELVWRVGVWFLCIHSKSY